MAKEPGQEEKGVGQDDPLYKEWLSSGQEHLSRVFGRRLADVLVALAILLLVFLAVSFVSGLIWYLNPIFSANDKLSTTDRKDLVQGFASVAQAAAVGLAGAVGLVGLFFTWRSLKQTQESTRETLELAEQGQITERFTRAIDQLGATDDKQTPRLEIRLGGIYALATIASDSDAYYWPIIEILSAYIRERSRWPPQGDSECGEVSQAEEELTHQHRLPDIQAILYILKELAEERKLKEGKRSYGDGKRKFISLTNTDLRNADLRGAHLVWARLRGANLKGARLYGAHLRIARLHKAIFEEAKLRGAELQSADLEQAVLCKADFRSAKLAGAILKGADLRGAKVTDEQLEDVRSLQGATMPDGKKYEDWLKDKEGSGKDVENE